jgi:adenylate kinase
LSAAHKDKSTRPGRVVVIMGPPNAGKDTQGELLATKLDATYIGSGNLIRNEADPRLMAIINRGELAPEEDFRRLISQAIAKVPLEKTVILVGIAKRPEEAKWLVEHLPTLGRWLDRVALIKISQEVGIERSLQRSHGRADDHPELQAFRWSRFYELTQQSLDYFRDLGLLTEVDGVGSLNEVEQRIERAINAK